MVISADFEMAWAWRYSKTGNDPVEMGLRERRNVPILLDLFARYHIPVTWAVVGHLLLEHCEKTNGKPHDHLRRIPHFENRWRFLEGDWYDHDPCTGLREAPAWYAPDLVDGIIQSSVAHEIACHTFSHLNCSDQHCPPSVLDDELALCRRLARDKGLKLRSMVFPGGTYGNFKSLKRAGFTSYRFNDDPWDMYYPEKDVFGLWRIPSSAGIGTDPFHWSRGYTFHRYRKYIDRAISRGSVAHFWFHPSMDDSALGTTLPDILEYAANRRDRGDLWCTTMNGLSRFMESPSSN